LKQIDYRKKCALKGEFIMKTTPAREQLLEARNKTVSDIIAAGLKVLFCGINPGLYSAAVNHHFARPGNRFWPALYRSGFTPRLYHPSEENLLLSSKLGITNIVARATASADEISREELEEGGRRLAEKVKRYKPKAVAILGLGAYRSAFHNPMARLGLQETKLGDTPVWVLPNPSGINTRYRIEDLVRCMEMLRKWVEEISRGNF
jgi:TDG/mug DNA glycosylase family protein